MERGNENADLGLWVHCGGPLSKELSWAMEGPLHTSQWLCPDYCMPTYLLIFAIKKTMHRPPVRQRIPFLQRLGCSMFILSHAQACEAVDDHSYLIRSVCWFERRPYAVKWKQKTKFSWAILLFLLQVLGHFTKAAQTRMSLVLKPQVNLPLFHMIKPDNCVLIANVVGEIQFLGPS